MLTCHLQYLHMLWGIWQVIDEADRIMEHVKQDWLSHVENAAFSGDRQPPSSLNVHK